MIRRSLSTAVLAAFLLVGAHVAADVRLSIRFFDKRIYFPGSEIPLMITISNESESTFRFKVADDRVYSLSFEARTPSNRLLDLSDGFKVAMSQSRPVFYRELAIKPGEEYSFREALERFVRVDKPGTYTVKAVFFPELAWQSPPSPRMCSASRFGPLPVCHPHLRQSVLSLVRR